MNEWVFFILLHIIGYSGAQVLLKHITKSYKFDLNGIAFASLLVSVLILSPFIAYTIYQTNTISTAPEGYLFLLISIASDSAALYLVFRAVKIGELSVVGPLDTLRPIIVTILGIFILSEAFKINIFAAAALATIGAFIIHYKSGFSRTLENIGKSKASLLMLANSFVISISAISNKLALQFIQPHILTFFVLFGMCLVYSFIVFKNKIEIRKIFIVPVIAMGTIKLVASIGIFFAFFYISPGIAVTAQMSRSIVMALLGYFIFDEKEILKKVIGAAIMLAGVALLFL